MLGVILDADSLGQDIDLSPVCDLLDDWQVYNFTEAHQIEDRILAADVVLSNKIPLTESGLTAAANLKFVSVMATGTNNIDLSTASRLGIQVSNAVAYATPSVVQHTVSLILALSNNLIRYSSDVSSGAWQQSKVFCLLDHPIQEIANKQLGIIGHGELGSAVGAAASALGMRVAISDRPGSEPRSGRQDFGTVLAESDYISLHCPLTDTNHHLINADTLAQMKTSAFLINTARGALVDSAALIDALNNNQIAGAAVDVVAKEPPDDSELLLQGHSKLIVTPHNAWGAIESRRRLIIQMRENIEGFLAGSPPRQVNAIGET